MLQRGPSFEQTGFAPAWRADRQPEDCHLAWIGRFRSFGGFRWQQTSGRTVLHVIEDGCGWFHSGGRSFECRRGSVMAFFPGMQVRYHDDPAQPWRYSWLVIGGGRAIEALGRCGLTPATPWTTASDYRSLSAWCERVTAAYSSGDHGPCFPMAAAWGCLDAIAAQPTGTAATPGHIAEVCREWIEQHALAAPSIEDIAQQLGVSRSTLFRAFRARYGRSPKTHLDACRMERAARLLDETRLPIAEIARLCGYRSADYFTGAFRRSFGMAPSQRRNSQGQG